MNWFRKEPPRPLRVATSETYAEHVSTQLKTIIDGQNLLLQSHAALEQRFDAYDKWNVLFTRTLAMLDTKVDALDARLKGTGDAISLLLEERFATLDQQIAYILHDLLADLRKAKEPARRKGKK